MTQRPKLRFTALILSTVMLSACSNVTVHGAPQKGFNIYGDVIPFLTNDKVTDCTQTQKSDDTICVLISGKVSEERVGKVVAYGLLLENAGWAKYTPSIDNYANADALRRTPTTMRFHKADKTGCKKNIILTPVTLPETEKTELSISGQKNQCNG